MKLVEHLLTMLITVVVIAIGGFFTLQQHYTSKHEVKKLHNALALMEQQIVKVDQKTNVKQKKTDASIDYTHEKLASLQKHTRHTIDRLDNWKKIQADKLQQIKEEMASLEKKLATQIALQKQSIDSALRSLAQTTHTDLVALKKANRDVSANLNDQMLAFSNAHVAVNDLPGILDQTFKSFFANYTSTRLDLGPLPSGRAGGITRTIPADIPDDAHEILIYVYIATNYVRGETHSFKIAVKPSPSTEAAFYLYAVANTQQEWSYNSDNFWLPMPTDRKLHLETSGKPLFGNWTSRVVIIAYR